MKNIVINNDFLKDIEIDEVVKKCRCVFFANNKILVEKYAGLYMLPGGKLDADEDVISAVVREIKEELGMDINKSNLTPFLYVENLCRNYPKTDGRKINRSIKTMYFISNIPYEINRSRANLSQREINGNLTFEVLDLIELKKLLTFNSNPDAKNSIFSQELLEVILNLDFINEKIKKQI